jgi:AsmA protein
LNVSLKFSDGIATADNVRIDGPATRLTLSGTASVPSREYDLKGVASLVSTSNTTSEFDLPFVVQGPWEDPLIFPADPVSLIKRSPVAAPLLDAVKDPKTRDAVRSALERFGGGAKSSTSDADPDSGPATVENTKPN